MLTPAKRKLTVIKGATFNPGWVWRAGGVLADLTGCTARMQVRDPDTGALLLELTTENGGIVLGGQAGTIDLWVGALATTLIAWESGAWALELQYAAGPDHVDRLIEGSITVSPEVVRPGL